MSDDIKRCASPAALTDAARRLMLAANDVGQGRAIHNERHPDRRIDGAVWVELRNASASMRALLAAQPAADAERQRDCKCRRLGDWNGAHHPLCDDAQPAEPARGESREAFNEWFNAKLARGMTAEEIAFGMHVNNVGVVRERDAARADRQGDGYVREFEEWVKQTGALPWSGSWMAEVSSIIRRAAGKDRPWIAVADRLPTAETDFLVKGIKHSGLYHDVAGLFHGKWLSQVTQDECKFEVSHWMPLPTGESRVDRQGVALSDDEWSELFEAALWHSFPMFQRKAAVILSRASSSRAEVESAAASDVLAERRRQVEAEGWTPEHDDKHEPGELAAAAGCYAIWGWSGYSYSKAGEPPKPWPWDEKWWKPADLRRQCVKAGALILAAIERIDRLAAAEAPNGEDK